MPPKKGPKKLTENQKQRNAFHRRKRADLPFCVESGIPQYSLFASRLERPDPKFNKKKTHQKKAAKNLSPNVSVEPVSSDDEDAGQFQVVEKNDDEEELELQKLNAQNDTREFPSMEVFNDDGFQCVWNGKGNYIQKDKQPPREWRPAPAIETVGNFPMLNKPAKRNKVVAAMKKKEAGFKSFVSKPLFNYQGSACATFRAAMENGILEKEEKRLTLRGDFRVFDTPTKRRILKELKQHNHQLTPKNDRLLTFSYTPIRGKKAEDIDNIDCSSITFCPKNASTPVEKTTQSRRTKLVFISADEEEVGPEAEKEKSDAHILLNSRQEALEEHQNSETEKNKTICEVPGPVQISIIDPRKSTEPSVMDDNKIISTSNNRKAETSVADLLEEADEEEEGSQAYLEDSKYAKKRQRTASPNTMCQGTSTVMTTQNEYGDLASDVILDEEKEENMVQKRGTLQPQQRQRDRESRCSRVSTMSVGSYNEFINSAMEEMSLEDNIFLETMGEELGKTQFSESRAESRNVPTAMTIINDDPAMVPFYLADASLTTDLSPMAQLLHVAGQTEIKSWKSLPEAAFKPRALKKLGEGSYGEVFATTWEKKKVAIKVVPFESDKYNRIYSGEYHSVQMQPADEILPELIVMKELNRLRDITGENSTPNFIELISAEIVVGEFPPGMLTAWNRYAKNVKESENTNMKIYSSVKQKSILFVSGNGGIALEDFVLQTEQEIYSIVHQLVISMVVAEAELEFEHRDLHLGNVLIDRNGVEELYYKYKHEKFALRTHGLKVNIIDFTLSRISKASTTVFLDLENDPGFFEGTGDPQFDVYRQMRKNCGGDWMTYNRRTNLMWIVFIANRLIDSDSSICPKGLLTEKRRKELRKIFTELGEFDKCEDSLSTLTFFQQFYEGYFGALETPEYFQSENNA